MDKDEFLKSLEEYPRAIKTKNDALLFASYLNYRLQQLAAKYDLLKFLVDEKYPDFFDQVAKKQLIKVHKEYQQAYESRKNRLVIEMTAQALKDGQNSQYD
jgi:hypothetical protein